tara:strand:+ start:6771 stop:12602 length:5832 start_codon:yes stop_codon:yes gene_type:complete
MSRTNRQMPQNTPMPPSMTQQSNQAAQAVQNTMSNLDFTEPPDVQIIESSCKLADFKNDTNNKWTNVLKEPITIKKGSQIRVASSFTDMRGMDSEIIQFVDSGNQQDNSHTIMTQLYTTNDGVNGKTTSYDYIAHGTFSNTLEVLQRGNQYPTGVQGSTTSGGGTGFEVDITSIGTNTSLVRANVNISAEGEGYRTGDAITSTPAGFTGFVIADDLGKMKNYHITSGGSFAGGTAITFSVSGSSGGSGATISNYTVPALVGGIPNGISIHQEGTGYAPGDQINVNNPTAGAEQLTFYVLSTGPNGEIFSKSFFDQGYNYQRAPVFRWAQTFDVSDNLCYGRNFKNRSYTAENGQEVSIYNNPPAMLEDVRLSCGDVIQNKEDEFVSGVFHKQGQGKEFLLKKCKQQFFSYPFELINTEGYTYLHVPYQDKTIIDSYGNELTIQESPGNQFANGMGISITFGMQDGGAIPDTTHFNTLHDDIIKNWAGVYTVGFTYNINAGITIDGVLYDRYVKIVLGANQNFDGNDLWKGVLTDYAFLGTGSITGYPAFSLQDLPFINETREDGNPMTGVGGTVRVQINGAGNGWASYANVDGGTGYRVGDQLKLLNADGSDSGIKVLVLLVDNVGGIRASAPQGSSLTRGTLAALGPFEMRVAQNPWYLIGLGNVINRPADDSFNPNPNAVGILRTNSRLGSNTCFEGYEGVYPPTMENLGIENSSDIPLANELLSATGYSGLFKPNGQYPFYDNFNNLNAVFSLHSEKAYLNINNNKNAKTIITFTANVGAGDNDFTNFNASNNQIQFSITKAKWTSLGQTADTLPQTYLKLLYTNNNNDPIEEHIYIHYWYDDGTNYVCNIRCRNIHQSQNSVTMSNIAGYNAKETMRTNVDPNEYNVKSGELIEFQYLTNDFTFCDDILVTWGFGTIDSLPGSIGMTATQNFFANNDINKDVLLTSKDWEGVYNGTSVSTDVLTSYNNGGFYYLTHAKEMLADVQDNFKDRTNYLNQMAFAQGMNEWAFTDLIENSFSSGNDYLLKPTEFRTSSVTTCQSIWEYEPFYTQKTFKIPQNFSVPSAIGAWWTRESHKLTGVRDMATGEIILEQAQCGLLQNEFVLPVYGANNRIGTGGEYLEDNILYPDSSGLEPGHCIGRLGVDQNATYLATEVMNLLPLRQVGDVASFYNIFFRTFFTIVRNYDPLKNTGNDPDRSPLKTIATIAKNIGNVNDSKASPPITGRTALDGTAMIDIDTGGTPDKSNYKLYELGTPNPSAADTPAFFGSTSTEYPVRYIENDANNTYGRAKASNFIGSDNLTLAYQTDLSAFTFQFFHQPFTSPFVDNSGGDISCRVFYGNRKIGVQNHDSFGGNNVANWCRPQFPQGTFTFEEILNNITTPDFGNGVNPLKSVDEIGRKFFQKLGYTSQDLGIEFDRFNKYRLTEQYGNLGIAEQIYQTEIVLDDNSSVNFTSFTTDFLSTNFAELDSADSILSSIPPPESSAGINSHIQRVTPTNGKSNKIINRWGDYIYYPYSLNSQTNSFSTEVSQVRYDNATDAYGSVGGLLLSEANRGMGLPNTQGSTTLVNDSTVPVTLNPDCNIYLSYTVQTTSNFITASELPRKLNHGHMVILTNLIQSPNYTLNNQGRLPGISIINKTFIQGDFILSMGMLTFYAKEDRTLTEITTEIVNNDYSVPTALGDQSTVIYEITNMQPRPEAPPAPIFARQQAAYSILQQMAQATGQNPQGINKIMQTMNDLRGLGLSALRDPNGDDSNVINQLSNYIDHFDIPNMNARERQEFFATPEGAEFLSQAQNLMSVEENMRVIDAYQQAGEDMNPIQDVIAEVQAHLGLAAGGLPPIPAMSIMEGDEGDIRDPDLSSLLQPILEEADIPRDEPSIKISPRRAETVSREAQSFLERTGGVSPRRARELAPLVGEVQPSPAGEKSKSAGDSGVGTSVATDE